MTDGNLGDVNVPAFLRTHNEEPDQEGSNIIQFGSAIKKPEDLEGIFNTSTDDSPKKSILSTPNLRDKTNLVDSLNNNGWCEGVEETGFKDLLTSMMNRRWMITSIVLFTFVMVTLGIIISIHVGTEVAGEWKELLLLLLGAFIGSYGKIIDYWFSDTDKYIFCRYL